MKTVELYGENYSGKWVRSRTACRGVVLREGKLLLSHETSSGLWMIPGGGLEPGEEEMACCIREVAEETGFLIQPSDCALVIEEYVYDLKHINRYYFGQVTGRCERQLTEREAKAELSETVISPSTAGSRADISIQNTGITWLRKPSTPERRTLSANRQVRYSTITSRSTSGLESVCSTEQRK